MRVLIDLDERRFECEVAQAAPATTLADFVAAAGHKAYSPFGASFLHGPRWLLDQAPPYLPGGGTASAVSQRSAEFVRSPDRHQGGTPNIGGVIAMAEALKFLDRIGMERVRAHELEILEDLREHDRQNRKFVVSMLDHGAHRNHVCLVFESLSMNLREALTKFGKNVGINMDSVRKYGKQLLVALRFLYQRGVVHADLKLDNILVAHNLRFVKLCDFGSAYYYDQRGVAARRVDEVEVTPYIRFPSGCTRSP